MFQRSGGYQQMFRVNPVNVGEYSSQLSQADQVQPRTSLVVVQLLLVN